VERLIVETQFVTIWIVFLIWYDLMLCHTSQLQETLTAMLQDTANIYASYQTFYKTPNQPVEHIVLQLKVH